jgi:hypothetical protein
MGAREERQTVCGSHHKQTLLSRHPRGPGAVYNLHRSRTMKEPEEATSSVVTVGDGRGFVVKGIRGGPRCVNKTVRSCPHITGTVYRFGLGKWLTIG